MGSAIFKPVNAVVRYISRGLNNLNTTVPKSKLTLDQIRTMELKLIHVPLMANLIAYQYQVMKRQDAGDSSGAPRITRAVSAEAYKVVKPATGTKPVVGVKRPQSDDDSVINVYVCSQRILLGFTLEMINEALIRYGAQPRRCRRRAALDLAEQLLLDSSSDKEDAGA